MADFDNKIIYQIYPKSFMDSDGDGLGDLKGVTAKLDYLKWLGVDYLWLTPFFPSPQRDNGYDVADYRSIDPRYGTMADLEELIYECDRRGMGLMLDMVFNHTSTEHEWFRRALAGDEKYQAYYIFRKGDPDKLPTNWGSKFGGPTWQYVDSLGKWYLHLFDVTQADLNWDNPEVRRELKEVINFWKGKGVKGFRFDVVNLISKPDVLEDDFEGDGRRFYTDGPRVHEYLKELVHDTGIGDMVTVGEMSSTSLDNCIRYSSPEERELSMCFNFHHLKVDYKDGNKWELMEPDYGALKKLFKSWQEGMQEGHGWNALFWCNHDQPRIVSRFGDEGRYWKESARMLAGMIHFMRGTPYIYQGEEIGMTNPHYGSIKQYRDVESLNYYRILLDAGKTEAEALGILDARSRDNSRTPMQWNDDRYAGFSDTEPWIPVSGAQGRINVESQLEDKGSVLYFYRELIRLRKEYPVIARGTIEFTAEDNNDVMAYRRCLDGECITVICNLRGRESICKASEVFGEAGTGAGRESVAAGAGAGTVSGNAGNRVTYGEGNVDAGNGKVNISSNAGNSAANGAGDVGKSVECGSGCDTGSAKCGSVCAADIVENGSGNAMGYPGMIRLIGNYETDPEWLKRLSGDIDSEGFGVPGTGSAGSGMGALAGSDGITGVEDEGLILRPYELLVLSTGNHEIGGSWHLGDVDYTRGNTRYI